MAVRVVKALGGDVASRWIDRLELPDLGFGYDRFGLEKESMALAMLGYTWLYRHYFRVRSEGHDHIPRHLDVSTPAGELHFGWMEQEGNGVSRSHEFVLTDVKTQIESRPSNLSDDLSKLNFTKKIMSMSEVGQCGGSLPF